MISSIIVSLLSSNALMTPTEMRVSPAKGITMANSVREVPKASIKPIAKTQQKVAAANTAKIAVQQPITVIKPIIKPVVTKVDQPIIQAPQKSEIKPVQAISTPVATTTPVTAPKSTTVSSKDSKFQQLKEQVTLKPEVLKLALAEYNKADKKGLVNKPYLTVIDYSRPSSEKRMWVIDVKRAAVTFHTHVAHGKNSGGLYSNSFSNKHNSKASSLGTFITSDTYQGANGYSLNLKGQNKGVNDNAHARRVVIHGADYVSKGYIAKKGQLGRSWGCPALERAITPKVINQIKGGSVLFSYHPQQHGKAAASMAA